MTKNTERKTWVSRLLRDRAGNFGMMTALVFPVILAAGGVAMDLANMVMIKTELQDATDAAALAAASALANDGRSVAEAKEIALRFLKVQMTGGTTIDNEEGKTEATKNDFDSVTAISVKETALSGAGKSFHVDVATSYTLQFNPFTRLLGQTSTTMNATSSAESATESKNALSMHFVLDRSGSMGEETNNTTSYPCPTKKNPNKICTEKLTRIASLKLATADLLTQLNTADPSSTYVRTAGVSYNDKAQSPTTFEWGTVSVGNYVNNLSASGYTDSSAAFKIAYDSLTSGAEEKAHKDKKNNGQIPTKYIVFMTDGDNNQAAADSKTRALCDSAKTAKIEVYTIAFMAPSGGQALLQYCATTSNHYFLAESTGDLIAAFKAIGERASAVVSRLTK